MRRRLALAAVALLLAVRSAAAAPAFAPQANPFDYAGEYRDPTWGGTYLRARWYQPALPSFVSRDPTPRRLSRYGYGGGNPLMRIDPGGLSYRSAVGAPVGHVFETLNAGIGGHFARFFLAPAMGILEILAAPKAFWRDIKHNTGGIDAFLAGGAAFELGSLGVGYAAAVRLVPSIATRLFAAKVAAETLLGSGQSIGASLHHGRVDERSLVEGLEYTLGPEVVGRLVAGLGYQPYDLTPERANLLVDRKLNAVNTIELRAHVGRGWHWQTLWRELGGNKYLDLSIRVSEDGSSVTYLGSTEYYPSYRSSFDLPALLERLHLEHLDLDGPVRLRSVRIVRDDFWDFKAQLHGPTPPSSPIGSGNASLHAKLVWTNLTGE